MEPLFENTYIIELNTFTVVDDWLNSQIIG